MWKLFSVSFSFVIMLVFATPTLAGQSYEALKSMFEAYGFEKVSSETIDEADGTLSVKNMTAEQGSYKFHIGEVRAANLRNENWGIIADQIVLSGASRSGDGLLIGFSNLNIDQVELPYPSVSRGVNLSKAILSDAIVIDDTMNAFSFDRLIISSDINRKIFEIGYQGYISGQVMSALIPWTLNPVSKDRVKFSGKVDFQFKSDDLALFDGMLKLEDYGAYRLKLNVAGVGSFLSISQDVIRSAFLDAKIVNAEIVLSDMKWLEAALKAHNEQERLEYIEFLSKLFGGLIAGFGTIDDGLLLKSSIEQFMEDPNRLVIKASPGLKAKDLMGKHERQSLNLNIVESLSENE